MRRSTKRKLPAPVNSPTQPGRPDKVLVNPLQPSADLTTDISLPKVAQLARKALLDSFTPPGLVIDHEQNIVHLHGDAGKYLEGLGSGATHALMSVLKRSLRGRVGRAVLQAMVQPKPVIRKNSVLTAKRSARLEIIVTPLPGKKKSYYLITFAEHELLASAPQRLMRELQQARLEIQTTVDKLKTSKNEMKAAHEENINVNASLPTVHGQLRSKIEELATCSNDLGTLMKSTGIAVVFLSPDLHIRRYTPAVKDLFDILPADIGRPLTNLTMQFTDHSLLQQAREVMETGQSCEVEVASNSGRVYVRRLLPHQKRENERSGIVLTFVDITACKAAEKELRANTMRHELILAGIIEYGIFMLDKEGCFAVWTASAERIFGYCEREVLGRYLDLIHVQEEKLTKRANRDIARAEVDGSARVDRWYQRKDGTRFWGTAILSVLRDEDGRPNGFAKVVRDNTDHKIAEGFLRKAQAARDHFWANVSHDLRTPLSATLLWAKVLGDQKTMDPAMLKEGLDAINQLAWEQQALIENLMAKAKVLEGSS